MSLHPHEHETALYAIYLTLAGQYHPDMSGEPREVAEIRLRRIEDAYEVLRDALRSVAPEATPPSRHGHPSLRQSQAALSERRRKGIFDSVIFVVVLATLAAALCYCIMDFING
ncbi:J domain-containing protein [Bradyrhizobium sp.]|uniref:J domain-containing protein n=1 Tax=Bradyrhizobium sp. TaxID=376 RepID=UPI003C670EBA